MVDNADMQRMATMVAETQRVRIRPLWDDQKMRKMMAAAYGFDRLGKTMAAAYGLDRLGKTMAAAYGLDRLGKTMAAAYGLDKVGKTMAAAQRERMRPLFNTPKFVGPMFGGELQRASQAMAEAHRASMRRALDASKVIRVGLGGEKMARMVADTQRTRLLFHTQELVGPMFGGEVQRLAQGMLNAYRVPMRPLFVGENMRQMMTAAAGRDRVARIVADTQRTRMRPLLHTEGMAEVAQSFLETTIAASSSATIGGPAPVPVSVPVKAPLFPGLADPWQQVRHWDLIDWIVFINLIVVIAGILVAMEQSHPQIKAPEDPGKVVRTVPEKASTTISTTSAAPPNSTNPAKGSKMRQSLDDEKGRIQTVTPSPTSSSR